MTNLLRTFSRAVQLPLLIIALAFGAPAALAATITVNTEADNATDGLCSFTEAIASANTDTAVGGCTAGSGADYIVFSLTAFVVDSRLDTRRRRHCARSPRRHTMAEQSRRPDATGRVTLAQRPRARAFSVKRRSHGTEYPHDPRPAEEGGLIYVGQASESPGG